MNLEEFEDLVDRCGENVSRWPAPFREQGAALLRASEAAREIVSCAALLRRTLGEAEPIRAPSALVDRIVSSASRQATSRLPAPRAGRRSWMIGWMPTIASGRSLMRPAVLLSLCFLIGASAGLLFFPVQGNADQVDFPTLLARVVN
jgi:hypothetical protein